MKANEVYELIEEGKWAQPVCQHHFPFIWKMRTGPTTKVLPEVTIRIPTRKKTKWGKPKPERRRLDAVAFIQPHYKAFGNDLLWIGFEIKVSKSDLMRDTKMFKYLDYVDSLYLVVPESLKEVAELKLKDGMGLMVASLGKIHVHTFATRKKATWMKRAQMAEEFALKSLKAQNDDQNM